MKGTCRKPMVYKHANNAIRRLNRTNYKEKKLCDVFLHLLQNFYRKSVSAREVGLFCHIVQSKFLRQLGSEYINFCVNEYREEYVNKAKERDAKQYQIGLLYQDKQNKRIEREIQHMFNSAGHETGGYEQAKSGVRSITLIASR